ncbi:MAG: outer membrane beta-barrel protein [Reichenbachiella sp.]|uniref:outer membrane beta-barrel protein n=1 Tax=Reichenbachiella sp. TaxID=2184521 RepID=UPI0032677E33
MMTRWLVVLFLVFVVLDTPMAQTVEINVSGVVVDKEDLSALVGARVLLINIKDSTQSKYGIANDKGEFLIQNLQRAFYRLHITSLGFKTHTQILRVTNSELDLGQIRLTADVEILDEVQIKGAVIPVEQKGDTVLYNAEAFSVNPDASTRDLVTKMPGIMVDDSGVTANGESIQQVLLDGKRFFGQDPLLSLNTIPAEVVEKIEVFDQQSEQSQFTGFDDGNTTKTMNVVTKVDRGQGQFGKLYGGYGSDDRYKIGGQLNSFKKESRLTLLAMSNDINQQNFSEEDLVGVASARSGRRESGGALMTGIQNGITETNSLGSNLSKEWGEKVKLEGSYFFNQTNNVQDQELSRETFLEDQSQFYTEEQIKEADNYNHRFNSRFFYNINENNNLIVHPSLSFQKYIGQESTLGETSIDDGGFTNQTQNNFTSEDEALSFENKLIYQHKFEKIGRSISLEFDMERNTKKNSSLYHDLTTDSVIIYSTDRNEYEFGGSISYAEPIGNTALLSASYEIDYDNRNLSKEAFDGRFGSTETESISSLTNDFDSDYTRHRYSLEFSNRSYDLFYRFGVTYQYATLLGEDGLPGNTRFQQSFHNFLPIIVGRLEFGDGANITFRYRTSTSAPSVTQLQNVLDNSNPLFWSIGNPLLKQSYTHNIFLRYTKTNSDKNTTFSNFTYTQILEDYLTSATYVLTEDSVYTEDLYIPRGTQISQPVNMDGYWQVSNNTSFGMLLPAIKTNINTTVGVSYTRQPGMTNGILNHSNTYSGNVRLALTSNIDENTDFNVYYDLSTNKVTNSIQEVSNSRYLTHVLGAKANIIFWKMFVFRTDLTYENYQGVNESFDTEYFLWNMSLAKKFLKNNQAELELSVFDLLNQNRDVSQTVGSSYLQEKRTEVLRQYLMLTFTYQLRNFKS